MRITVSNRQRAVRVDLAWLRKFARLCVARCRSYEAGANPALPQLKQVDVAIVADSVIADVHRHFMNIEGPTDVITFHHGEIVIGADTAKWNAARFETELSTEIARYITHGLLHLAGFCDKEAKDAKKMQKVQEKVLDECMRILRMSRRS
jgi:probable rRNA maturation factor